MSFLFNVSNHAFDLRLCVTSGQVFRWSQRPNGDWIGADGGSWFVVTPVLDGYAVESNAEEARFRSLFRLDVDFAHLSANWDELKPLIAALPGMRPMRPADPVEVLFSFLCTANNHLARIGRMIARFEPLGEPLGPTWRFPSLEALTETNESHWREVGFGYRAPRVPAVARALLDRGGEAYLLSLRDVPFAEARRALIELPGLGPKLADCIALYGLHHGKAVPIDTHMWQAGTRLFFPEWHGQSLTATRYAALQAAMQERFGLEAGWAHLYLYFGNLIATKKPVNRR